MTTASPPSPDAALDEAPEPGGGRRGGAGPRAPRRRRGRLWRIGYPLALVVLAAAIPLLVWAGLRVILDSTDGQLVRRVTDPAAPGYEAVLEPTPTDLVVLTGPGGELDSILVLALTSDGAGGVLSVPAGTMVPLPTGQISLRGVYDNLGQDVLRNALGDLLDLTFTDAQAIGSGQWPSLVAPAGPVTVDSPDPVVGAGGTVLFPRGSVELTGDEVWPYLSGGSAGESDLARQVRIQRFWEGWMSAIAAKGDAGIAGPTDVGLGRFLSGLAPSAVQYEVLPVSEVAPDAQGNEQFEPDVDATLAAVATIVPFPEGAPGLRPRVRMLDGTGQLDHGVSAAIALAAVGAQIDVVGNARSFGQETTQIVYYDPRFQEAADTYRDALGVGEVVQSEQSNAATDLTVVLGQDYLDRGGAASSVAPPSTRETQGG